MLEKIVERYTGLFNNKYIDKVRNLSLAISVLLIVVAIQLIYMIVVTNLAISASQSKEIHITVPKTIKEGEYTVGVNTASKSYFKAIGYSILYTGSSFSYRDYKEKIKFIFTYVHPDFYDKLYAEKKQEVDFAIKNRVEQKFNIRDWKYKQINKSKARIIAKGYLTRKVGGVETIHHKPYIYYVDIVVKGGIPYMVDYGLKEN